jgi:hypothetical protein
MLRGVNLGPNRRIKMDDLRAVYESLGLRDVRTYVQSGNVVFKTRRVVPAGRLEDAIEKRFGFSFVRDPQDPGGAARRGRAKSVPGVEPSKLAVWFLAADPVKPLAPKSARSTRRPRNCMPKLASSTSTSRTAWAGRRST